MERPTRREILALYEWAPGNCFRCARTDTNTIHLDELNPPAGGHYEVRVCEECVLELEEERRRYAERVDCKYKPGRLGPGGA